ncbi:hypothetical protein SAMN05421690_100118 [Nitrosomonas sp. Nm51]|nr:hypothetical protein SAMN05421690_100118 [Nitrosomonas sp. Nm51]
MFWREALPASAEQITANNNSQASDNLRKAITETLLTKAAGEHKAALDVMAGIAPEDDSNVKRPESIDRAK